MLYNYLKISFRTLAKNKLHTFINIAGLSLGLASVILISFYINYEINYDRYLPNHENLYRITWDTENPQTRTPHPMAQALVEDFPEVESAVSITPLWGSGLTRETYSIKNPLNDKRFDESEILAVDSTFFDVFDFPVLKGDARKALKTTQGILITSSTATKYFGDNDPIGKTLIVYPDSVSLEVMAVLADVPKQSHFHFDFLISYVREKSFEPDDEFYKWADFGHFNYIRLKNEADPKTLEAKLMPWLRKYVDISDEQFNKAIANNIGFRVQPITDIHLKSHLRWELEPNGNIEYVYIMGAAALLTLIIACINFMNLMTAKSSERAKEIGVRKTVGAARKQLSIQFLTESTLISLVSVFFAVLMVEAALPVYNVLTGQNIHLSYLQLIPMLIAFAVIAGFVSGIYPSMVLSAIRPHEIVKGKFQTSQSGTRLRSMLTVFQFSISMILLSGAWIIFNQLNYISNKNIGFSKEELIVIPLKNEDLSLRLNALKTELLKIEGVSSVSASSNMPGGQFNQNTISLAEKPDHEITCSEMFVDHDFLKTMNIELADGEFFRERQEGDRSVLFVINETAAKQLYAEGVVGKELQWHLYEEDQPLHGRVIGVVKDFHFQSFHDPLRPLLMVLYPAFNHLVVKVNTDNFSSKIASIQNTFQQFENNFDFEFAFLDDRLDKQYESEQRTGIIFSVFAVIAVIIACFGLFAMAMLSFSHRAKEVSVRKVLGASLAQIITLLLKDFTKLIVISIFLAIPVAWWLMDRWLDNFIYQVKIQPVVFVITGVLLLSIAWLTLSYLTLQTSKLNPAKTLKGE